MKKLITSKEYRDIKAVSSGRLKDIHLTTVHHALTKEFKETDAMRFGRYVHALLLEPETIGDFVVMPECGRRTKEGKEIYQIFINMSEGKTVITKDQEQDGKAIRDAVMRHPVAKNMVTGGESEYSYIAEDKETGLTKKCRPDMKKNGALIDFKTCVNAGYEEFARACGGLAYHLQAAYYLDVHNEATGEDIKDFFFVAMEKEAPYAVAVYQLNELDIDAGRQAYRAALNEYADYLDCKKNARDMSKFIHGYPPVISMLSIPHWYHNKIKVGR